MALARNIVPFQINKPENFVKHQSMQPVSYICSPVIPIDNLTSFPTYSFTFFEQTTLLFYGVFGIPPKSKIF